MKKTYTLQQFSRALLFNFLFDSLLQGVKEQLKKSSSLEALVSLLKNYYPSNVESPYLPSQAAVYETLIKFSAERNKPVPFPILPYSSEMMSSRLVCNRASHALVQRESDLRAIRADTVQEPED